MKTSSWMPPYLILVALGSACQSAPVANRNLSSFAETKKCDSTCSVYEKVVLEAIGVTTNAYYLAQQAKISEFHAQKKTAKTYQYEYRKSTDSIGTDDEAKAISGGIVYLAWSVIAQESLDGRALLFARILPAPIIFSVGGSVSAFSMEPVTKATPLRNDTDISGANFQMSLRYGAQKSAAEALADAENAKKSAEFIAAYSTYAKGISKRVALLLSLNTTEEIRVQRQIERRMKQSFDPALQSEVRSVSGRLDMEEVLRSANIDFDARIAALDRIVKSAGPSQTDQLPALYSERYALIAADLRSILKNFLAQVSKYDQNKQTRLADRYLEDASRIESFIERIDVLRKLALSQGI